MHRDTAWEPGTPCWIDLMSPDADRAAAFYGDLFGWQFTDPIEEFGGYRNATKDGSLVCGLAPLMAEGQPTVWTTHLATADAAATAKRVVDAGGAMIAEPMPVDDLGVLAIAQAPDGGVFGLWQAGSHLGSAVVNELGAPVWNEFMTPDYEGALAFFGRVFGYEYAELGDGTFRYSTFAVDGRTVGGIGDESAASAAHWRTYFIVDDTNGAVRRVTELGGTLVREAIDSPFGRWAIVADPFGAEFNVIVPPGG